MRGLAVTSRPRHDDAGPGPAGQALVLVLKLSPDGGDPVSGTVGLADGPPPVPFHGWIDLMSAINTLRANAGHTA